MSDLYLNGLTLGEMKWHIMNSGCCTIGTLSVAFNLPMNIVEELINRIIESKDFEITLKVGYLQT